MSPDSVRPKTLLSAVGSFLDAEFIGAIDALMLGADRWHQTLSGWIRGGNRDLAAQSSSPVEVPVWLFVDLLDALALRRVLGTSTIVARRLLFRWQDLSDNLCAHVVDAYRFGSVDVGARLMSSDVVQLTPLTASERRMIGEVAQECWSACRVRVRALPEGTPDREDARAQLLDWRDLCVAMTGTVGRRRRGMDDPPEPFMGE